jgi:hypothetical protein
VAIAAQCDQVVFTDCASIGKVRRFSITVQFAGTQNGELNKRQQRGESAVDDESGRHRKSLSSSQIFSADSLQRLQKMLFRD